MARTAAKKDEGGMLTVTVRLPLEMVENLDGFIAEKQAELMGNPYTRSDGIREFLKVGLQRWVGRRRT